MPLTLALTLTLPLTARVRAALPLALTLALAARVRAALTLTLALALLAVALLPGLALLAALALLATRVREVPPGVLEAGGGARQVAVDPRALACALERIAEPAQGFLCALRVALGQARDRVAEGLPGGAVGLARGSLELGKLAPELVALGLGHLVDLVTQLVEILVRLLGIPVRVRLRVPGRRARQGARERGDRGRPLLVGGIELGPDVVLHRAQLGEVLVQVARVVAQPLGEVLELVGQLLAGIVGVRALAVEVLGDLVDLVRLALSLLADLPVLLDDEVHRVGEQDSRHDEGRGQDGRDRRATREPRAEQPGLHGPQAAHGVSPLAPHEARLRGRDVERAIDHDRLVLRSLERARVGGMDRCERERRSHGVAGAALGVDRQGRFAQGGPRTHDEDEQDEEPEHRQRGRDERCLLEREQPLRDHEHELRHHDDGEHVPGAPDGTPEPQPPAMRDEAGPELDQRRVERDAQRRRVGGDVRRRRRRVPARLGSATGRQTEPRDHASPPEGCGTALRRRRMRQRRVGETSWTDRMIRTTETASIARRLRGQ